MTASGPKPLQATGVSIDAATRPFNAQLDIEDSRENVRPYLAEALPQLNTDNWRVLPDGRMETSYRLKPNLVWHDGAPLSAADFVFAWQVYSTPELGVSTSRPLNAMEEVVASDANSVLIRWRRPYPDAGAVGPIRSTIGCGRPTTRSSTEPSGSGRSCRWRSW